MITKYFEDVISVMKCLDVSKVYDIVKLIKKHKRIFVIGNGGSAAIAEHFATDLMKFCDKCVYTISNSSLLTMCSNDFGYSESFYWPLSKMAKESDLIICFSTSGRSKNIIRVLELYNNTILITGRNGESACKLAKVWLMLDHIQPQIIEDLISTICHSVSVELAYK